MTSAKQCSLTKIIAMDLVRYSKIPIFFLIAVIISAFLVVITAYKTRLIVTQRERLILECDALDIEWRNLILEENALSKYNIDEPISYTAIKMKN
ncbi:cell division protein FtsL [Candidatus Erwinia haradaeae]|uniref:Cell division protein FtsL n=1 Tax=Candidatus Erwinia haradaeae TaxID=1922217 RepID=A0A803FT60_9GAMM|nr:cell division protein FtsL [Candidatus Erwinia haradaeae]VFP87678.1 Cell division protein FtsL [Candidatus Erwinia haradaeae]